MSEYISFEELKQKLGDKYEEYTYQANIELLNKIGIAQDYLTYLRKNCKHRLNNGHLRKLQKILDEKGVDNEQQ